ncbi:hypothetical protein ACI79C_14130 [Geodermatophilus sp. SYSU D00697]
MTANGSVLSPGGPERLVLGLFEEVERTSTFPAVIRDFVRRSGIPAHRFTAPVERQMVTWLVDRGADAATVSDTQLTLAFEQAQSAAAGEADPIDAARNRGSVATWDFTVDEFLDIEAQGIVRENILAAGAVDYVYEIGDAMGVFPLADALVLNWSAGVIDVVEGEGAQLLYRYFKLRDERSAPEERAMLYRRVLGKGGGKVLSRMVVNDAFPQLWHNFMAEVADYIHKTERLEDGRSESSSVSRSGIHQATRDLQYNLTEFCTGMAHMQVRELYAQLQEALRLLGHPDVVAHFGGNRRKSLWTVIEKLSRAEYGRAPDIGALRTSAVQGNRVFRWVADFNEGTTSYDDFAAMVDAAEAYIHAQAALSEESADLFAEEDEDPDDRADEDEFGDDF